MTLAAAATRAPAAAGARRLARRTSCLGREAHAPGAAGRLGGRCLGLRRLRVLVGLGLGLAVLAGLGVRLRLFLVGTDQVALLLLVGLKVGLVPAAALEAEHRRGHQLLQAALTARRALGQRRVGDLLHHLGVELAGLTLVLVERHG